MTLGLTCEVQWKADCHMIILVDDRSDVTAAYRASFGREGISAASFTPTDFDSWFHSTSGPDLAAVEAFILGDFDRRETLTRVIKTRTEAPAIALNDSTGLESTLKLFAAGADDVVRKPVHAREIIARIGAIRRRATPSAKAATVGDLRVFNDGRDPEVGGTVLALPRRERRMIEQFAIRADGCREGAAGARRAVHTGDRARGEALCAADRRQAVPDIAGSVSYRDIEGHQTGCDGIALLMSELEDQILLSSCSSAGSAAACFLRPDSPAHVFRCMSGCLRQWA